MVEARTPLVLTNHALDRLLDKEVMRAIIDPAAHVPGADNMSIRLAEFWEVIDIVRRSAGQRFSSLEDAEAGLFASASGGGFGIRSDLCDAVISLLVPVTATGD